MDFAKLALTGLITGLSLTACDDQAATERAVEQPAAERAVEQPVAAVAQYVDVHSCAGLNSCKGLGGCKVSAAQLANLAEKAGTCCQPSRAPATTCCSG